MRFTLQQIDSETLNISSQDSGSDTHHASVPYARHAFRYAASGKQARTRRQTRSMITAMPWPTPMHIVHKA